MMSSLLTACALALNLASHHMEASIEYNENNLGAGIECGRLQAGWYLNSESHLSAYALYLQPLYARAGVTVSAAAGAVTGYARAPVLPAAAVAISVGYVRVLAIPPAGEAPATLGLQLVVPLGKKPT